MKDKLKYLPLLFLDLTGIILIALQIKLVGWILLALGLLLALLCNPNYRRDMLLIFSSMVILGLANINTDISFSHLLSIAILLILAIIIPYFVSRYIFKDSHIIFKYCPIRNWYKQGILLIFIFAALSYIIIPYYLKSTGSYHSW